MQHQKEIFVFGSNLAGKHGKGSAKEALDFHGAIYGKGQGLQGNSYAIPTKDEQLRRLSLFEIQKHIRTFLSFAAKHEKLLFTIVAIGCGEAGYTPQDIAPMFQYFPYNCLLPKEFINVLKGRDEKIIVHMGYGQGKATVAALDVLDQLMKDQKYILVDTRISRASLKYPQWSEMNLRQRYQKRYVCATSLGNINRFNGQLPKLANPEKGIRFLFWLLLRERTPILICCCSNYLTCHRKLIIEEMMKIDPTLTIKNIF